MQCGGGGEGVRWQQARRMCGGAMGPEGGDLCFSRFKAQVGLKNTFQQTLPQGQVQHEGRQQHTVGVRLHGGNSPNTSPAFGFLPLLCLVSC